MANNLATLIRLLPPPSVSDDNSGDWQAVEAELGTPLPDDYKAFVKTYGNGALAIDPGYTSIWILNPFTSNRAKNLVSVSKLIAKYARTPEETVCVGEHGLFPDGDLLIWAESVDGDSLFWRTGGTPAQWSVVVSDRCKAKFFEYSDTSFSAFVLGLVDRSIANYGLPEGKVIFQTATQISEFFGYGDAE